MTPEEAEEYTQALEQSHAGGWRLTLLAVQLGVPETLGLSVPEWQRRLGGYVRLQMPERRAAVAELTAEGMSTRKIGDILGVDHSTIVRDSGANAPLEPEPVPSPQVDQIAELSTGANAPLSEIDQKSTRDLLGQSDQNDWRTPRKYLEAAHAVLGAIDLDPASSAEANETVQAALFYTEDDDGLSQPWKGRVWLNPPYGGNARKFIDRLIKEYEVGNVTAACALVNSHPTETQWFQQLFRYAVCFIRGRIDFGGPSRDVASTSTHGSAVAYLGPDLDAFAREFAQFGAVVRHV